MKRDDLIIHPSRSAAGFLPVTVDGQLGQVIGIERSKTEGGIRPRRRCGRRSPCRGWIGARGRARGRRAGLAVVCRRRIRSGRSWCGCGLRQRSLGGLRIDGSRRGGLEWEIARSSGTAGCRSAAPGDTPLAGFEGALALAAGAAGPMAGIRSGSGPSSGSAAAAGSAGAGAVVAAGCGLALPVVRLPVARLPVVRLPVARLPVVRLWTVPPPVVRRSAVLLDQETGRFRLVWLAQPGRSRFELLQRGATADREMLYPRFLSVQEPDPAMEQVPDLRCRAAVQARAGEWEPAAAEPPDFARQRPAAPAPPSNPVASAGGGLEGDARTVEVGGDDRAAGGLPGGVIP